VLDERLAGCRLGSAYVDPEKLDFPLIQDSVAIVPVPLILSFKLNLSPRHGGLLYFCHGRRVAADGGLRAFLPFMVYHHHRLGGTAILRPTDFYDQRQQA
jgi:hypothetical protein